MPSRRSRAWALHGTLGWFAGWLLGLLGSLQFALAAAAPLPAALEPEGPIGRSVAFLVETDGRLELADAIAALEAGRFSPGRSPVLNFGIGSKPVWIHFAVDNPAAAPLLRRLAVETAWLDRIEVYVRHRGATAAAQTAGDRQAFSQRPLVSRYFVFDLDFAPGTSDVFLRVETPDPMVVSLYLSGREAFRERQTQQELSYGIVYGFLLALMAYNAILYVSLRSARYLAYSTYLAMFVIMNIAYTGHGFQWFWPDATGWQQWSNPTLIYLYGLSGLLFALEFLDLRLYFPRVRKAVFAYCAGFGSLLAIALLLGSQQLALRVSFSFIVLFTGVMLFLGAISLRAGQRPAQFFLIAALSAMVGAALTTLSTWGFIPHNSWTFRAVEIGMLLDATLLALALADQLRVGHEKQLRAERLAQLDPLTGLNNRRAFYDKTGPLWSHALRHAHATSVMLLDIDRFKDINDAYGHAHGDEVLKALADTLRRSVRHGDVLARWGGEEFIVFLPETSLEEATALAERLRVAIAAMHIPHETGATTLTASFGVAQRDPDQLTLDALIAAADECQYQSKQAGRNRVTAQRPGSPQGQLDLAQSPGHARV